ncbi:MAG TPA: hypothetical protein DCK95_10735 [Anaerolineaceae bacterium]|nr:hypothetical protein [Anaerolineaceae bacterium]
MKNTIGQVMRKTYAYWWVDGTMDMAMGLLFGGLAASNYLMGKLQLSEPWDLILAIAEPLLFVLFWFLYGRLMKWIKEHITYRRTGYVAYQPKKKKKRIQSAVIGGVMGIFTALMVTYIGPEVLKIEPMLIAGCVMAVITLYLGYWYGVNRFFIVAPVEFGLALWISSLSMDGELKSIAVMAAIGATWIISGLATFILYLLRNRTSEEQEA